MAMFILEFIINVCMSHIMYKNLLISMATCPVQSEYRTEMVLFTEDYFMSD